MKNYSEEGYKRMVEAGARGRQKQREAQIELSEKKKLEYIANPKLCPTCGKTIPFKYRKENTYCGSSCAAKTSNKGRKKLASCLCCGKSIQFRNKYCSAQCQQDLKYKENIEKWLNGEIDLSTTMGCSGTVKRYLLEQCDHKCPKCGWKEVNPVTNKVPLEINHIDGDSTNNRPENLEVLCPNCHSLTPNFRALNKKSSRTYRSLRSE
jgi:predicted nucleic acid-binding Zn ribbon protein